MEKTIVGALVIKGLCVTEDLDRKAMSAIHGGRINLLDMPPEKTPQDGALGEAGTSWPNDGLHGLSPTYTVDGSSALPSNK